MVWNLLKRRKNNMSTKLLYAYQRECRLKEIKEKRSGQSLSSSEYTRLVSGIVNDSRIQAHIKMVRNSQIRRGDVISEGCKKENK